MQIKKSDPALLQNLSDFAGVYIELYLETFLLETISNCQQNLK
jgi:hypothetical protein